MDVFEADAQQREEELHRWWQENWKSIVMGIVLAIAIITVVFMYRDYTKKVKYQNAVDFYAIVMNSDLSDANSVNDVKKFIGDHSSDVYSQLASLSLAKQYVAEKKYQEAADLLKASIGASRDNILDDVIRKDQSRFFIVDLDIVPGDFCRISRIVDRAENKMPVLAAVFRNPINPDPFAAFPAGEAADGLKRLPFRAGFNRLNPGPGVIRCPGYGKYISVKPGTGHPDNRGRAVHIDVQFLRLRGL